MIVKRIFDFFFAMLGLFLLLPVFVVAALWVKVDSSGPIFFRQERIGKSGKPFQIFKFRTMVVNAEALGARVTVGADARITGSGVFLRKYKLDELPQLINVLKGEMSLVGPRPEVAEYVAYWPEEIRGLILSVSPGITDFASIEFHDEASILAKSKDPQRAYIEEILPIKQNYYLRYVRERSLLLDIKLIMLTLWVIIR